MNSLRLQLNSLVLIVLFAKPHLAFLNFPWLCRMNMFTSFSAIIGAIKRAFLFAQVFECPHRISEATGRQDKIQWFEVSIENQIKAVVFDRFTARIRVGKMFPIERCSTRSKVGSGVLRLRTLPRTKPGPV
jgi:hypothetical protein